MSTVYALVGTYIVDEQEKQYVGGMASKIDQISCDKALKRTPRRQCTADNFHSGLRNSLTNINLRELDVGYSAPINILSMVVLLLRELDDGSSAPQL